MVQAKMKKSSRVTGAEDQEKDLVHDFFLGDDLRFSKLINW